jgi:hypothetical protein
VQFGTPSLLLGLVAAALPWLVHLIGKRRATPVRFAAMQLLLRSEKRISARRRLRELLLLAARTATAAALPLIFARPFTERAADVPAASMESQSAVILLDDSASLRRARGAGTLFDQAKGKALALVRQFPSDSELAVVVASQGSPAPLAELHPERSRVLQAVETVNCSARPADFTAAMRRAALILAASPRAKRRIFVVTDLQASGWEEGTGLTPRNAPEVVVVDVGETAWENRAVLDVRAEPAAEAGPGGVAVLAQVKDHSTRGSPGLGLALKVDGVVVAKGFVELGAGGTAKKRFVHVLPAGSGSAHDIEVEIDPDVFRADDRRSTHIELARTVRALVINGDARTVDKDDEPYFLERALKAGDQAASLTTVLPDDVPLEGLSAYTAVYVLNVAQPSAPLATALVRFVEGGGGLFLSVGARVDPQTWNDRLGKLLPQPLAMARTAAALPGQHAGETLDDRQAERLAPLDRRHPLLANFPPHGEGLVFGPLLQIHPARAGAGLARAGGGPALRERRPGAGGAAGGQGAGAAPQHQRRSGVDRPADPARVPPPDAGGGPPPGGGLGQRGGPGPAGRPAPRPGAGRRRAAGRGHQAGRLGLGGAQRDAGGRADGHLPRDRRAGPLPGAGGGAGRGAGPAGGGWVRGQRRHQGVEPRPAGARQAPRSPADRGQRRPAAEAARRALARAGRAPDPVRARRVGPHAALAAAGPRRAAVSGAGELFGVLATTAGGAGSRSPSPP